MADSTYRNRNGYPVWLACERNNLHRDIDLAIQLVSGETMQAEQKLNYLTQLIKLLETDIDSVDLKTVGQPLLSQIMKYGKRMMAERRKRWLANG